MGLPIVEWFNTLLIVDALSPLLIHTMSSWIVPVLLFVLVTSLAQKPSWAFRTFLRRNNKPRSTLTTTDGTMASPTSVVGNSPLSPLSKKFPEDAFLKETMQWWDDLAPPSFEYRPNLQAATVHFCFLVHGHRGLSVDLSYLQTQMHQQAHEWVGGDQMSSSVDMVIHSAVCNEKKTTDGVKLGGERLAQEMLQVIREHMRDRNATVLTISVVGNSLGGLYARYAVSMLAELCPASLDDPFVLILDDMYRVRLNVFCTTATPHLGVAGHTFLPLPRTAEIGVAHAMGETGRDLFRLNDVLKTMATSPTFVKPLGIFRKRIAYANAYGTDFPVPAHTAAFLSESSEYPHHFLDDGDTQDRLVVDDNGLVIATLHTPPLPEDTKLPHDDMDDLVLMSTALDSLGWKKVFIDVRKEIPRIPLPPIRLRRSSATDSSSSDSETGDDAPVEPIEHLRERRVVGSKDVAAAVTKPIFDSRQFHWPMGHNMIVAFSRSRFSSYLNRAGRPFVDNLARDLVHDIFSLDEAFDASRTIAVAAPLPRDASQSTIH